MHPLAVLPCCIAFYPPAFLHACTRARVQLREFARGSAAAKQRTTHALARRTRAHELRT